MFTDKDEPTDNPAFRSMRSYRLYVLVECRFGKNKPLPFGGFPASSLL
ncbi:hypothetical protein [Acinetobacter baumannii]